MTRLQAVQWGDVLLTVRLSPGMTPSTGTRRWPVAGWAGLRPTRSSTCSCTGEENRAFFLWTLVDADDGGAFRSDTAAVTGQYQFPDDRPGDEDAFAREPFVVRFRAPKTGECPPASMNTSRCDRWMFHPQQPSRSLCSSLNTRLQPTPPRSCRPSTRSSRT